jgi:hypothetical protein
LNQWPVVIHCSDTKNGRSLEHGSKTSADIIDEWHKQRGWSKIGYHYVIDVDGTIERGRGLNEKGAHTRGFNDSWGICFIGRDKFNIEQFESLGIILEGLRLSPSDLKPWNIYCHYEKNPKKTCPNMRAANLVVWYRALEYGAISDYLIKDPLGL